MITTASQATCEGFSKVRAVSGHPLMVRLTRCGLTLPIDRCARLLFCLYHKLFRNIKKFGNARIEFIRSTYTRQLPFRRYFACKEFEIYIMFFCILPFVINLVHEVCTFLSFINLNFINKTIIYKTLNHIVSS